MASQVASQLSRGAAAERGKSEYGGRGIRTPEGLHLSGFQAPTAIWRLLLNTKPGPEGHFHSGDFTTGSASPAERCADRSVFSRRPMWTVARMSKERKRKSSGTKTAWVFSYKPFGNEPPTS
jgi:hypothetical protein